MKYLTSSDTSRGRKSLKCTFGIGEYFRAPCKINCRIERGTRADLISHGMDYYHSGVKKVSQHQRNLSYSKGKTNTGRHRLIHAVKLSSSVGSVNLKKKKKTFRSCESAKDSCKSNLSPFPKATRQQAQKLKYF
jgi:hypothetical protein